MTAIITTAGAERETKEKEVQTEAEFEATDAVSRISAAEEISPKEEKETSTEKVSVADSSVQTDLGEAGILHDGVSEEGPKVSDAPPASEECGRISACTQTLASEGAASVCEAEVQTDADEREGHRTSRSFLGSPTDELVS